MSPLRALLARRRPAPQHADEGFTLIEVLVALTIFAIVSAAAVIALVAGVRAGNDSNDRVTAAQVAQQEVDRARALPAPSLAASPDATRTTVLGGKSFSVTRTIGYPAGSCLAPSATPTDATVRKMQVTVVVRIPGEAGRAVRIDSVIAC